MTAGLETFAKVRALHDRTDSPGEKAAAASRMDVLARAIGMTTAEAVSKLDREAARQASGGDWSDLADALRRAAAAQAAADAPEARSQRYGLPIYDPSKVEPWRDVAEHCLGLDWIIPKACGGKFLTKVERERLKVIVRHYGLVTNADAAWIETVLGRCMKAREVWLDREPPRGMRRDPKPTTEGRTEARPASKLDATPPPSPAEGGGSGGFFDTPLFREGLARHERERAARWCEVLEEYGSEEAVFTPGELEQALDDAETRFGPDPGWQAYPLDAVPAAIVAAVEAASPMPATVRGAWNEFAFWDKLGRDREARGTACGDHSPPVTIRWRLLERMLDTMPARSTDDIRARLDWFDWLNRMETSPDPKEERVRLATLRADIERMGARLREQDAEGVQTGRKTWGNETIPHPDVGPTATPSPAVQTGHRPSTRADRRAAARALLAEGLTDREIARRLGISPSTVGTLRKGAL